MILALSSPIKFIYTKKTRLSSVIIHEENSMGYFYSFDMLRHKELCDGFEARKHCVF